MPAGDLVIFNKAKKSIGGEFDLTNPSDFKVMLIDSLPGVDDAIPDTSSYTEVAPIGTIYQAGGLALATTWDEATGTVTFDSSVNPLWEKDVNGPTNIIAGLIYSISAIGANALGFVDMTDDFGVTPLDLTIGRVSITWNLSGIFTLS